MENLTPTQSLNIFCRQIRNRSSENQKALKQLIREELYAPAISLLRQELDSMIRVIYLLEVDENERNRLITASVEGEEWKRQSKKGKMVRITDREMADCAVKTNGWVDVIYKFGCNLIHLSKFHDYKDRDPIDNVEESVRNQILSYLKTHQCYPAEKLIFSEILHCLPGIMKKIASNLEHYVQTLETQYGA